RGCTPFPYPPLFRSRLDGRLAALGARDALAGRDLLLPARPRGCGPALEVGLGRRPRRVLGPDRRRLVGGAHAPRPELVDDVAARSEEHTSELQSREN